MVSADIPGLGLEWCPQTSLGMLEWCAADIPPRLCLGRGAMWGVWPGDGGGVREGPARVRISRTEEREHERPLRCWLLNGLSLSRLGHWRQVRGRAGSGLGRIRRAKGTTSASSSRERWRLLPAYRRFVGTALLNQVQFVPYNHDRRVLWRSFRCDARFCGAAGGQCTAAYVVELPRFFMRDVRTDLYLRTDVYLIRLSYVGARDIPVLLVCYLQHPAAAGGNIPLLRY
jgi:hypothetical protein